MLQDTRDLYRSFVAVPSHLRNEGVPGGFRNAIQGFRPEGLEAASEIRSGFLGPELQWRDVSI